MLRLEASCDSYRLRTFPEVTQNFEEFSDPDANLLIIYGGVLM